MDRTWTSEVFRNFGSLEADPTNHKTNAMQQQDFSPQDSLKVIQSMLEKTREDFSSDDIYFLIWGWVTFIACTAQFVLKNILHSPKHPLVWWIIIPAVIFTIYHSIKEEKTARVKTYIAESMKWLWIGMGISYFVLSMILSKAGWGSTVFPFYILLYGLGTFVSGCFIRFRPLVIGGICAWAIAVASVFLEYDYQILAAAAAILFSYIVPAYMLRRKIKSVTAQSFL